MSINLYSAFNWYGFIIGSGMAICLVLAHFTAKKRGYYADIVFDIAIICIPLTIIGLRLYYVIFDIIGNGTKWTFREILGLDGGGLRGLAIYGGLIGASIGAVIIHFWKHKKPEKARVTFMQLMDLGFTFIILGQAIGRWGNFANQEAFGPKVDWHFFPLTVKIDAQHATDGAGYYLATFFYESFWNIIGFFALYKLYTGKRQSFDGFIFSLYCIYYGIGRTWIEGLRQDSLYGFMGLRVSQVVSVMMIIFGITYIIYHLYKARSLGLKPFILVEREKLDASYYGYEKSILHHPNDHTKKKKTEDAPDESEDFYAAADSGFDNAEDFYDADESENGRKKESADEKNAAELDKPAEADNSAEKDDDFYN